MSQAFVPSSTTRHSGHPDGQTVAPRVLVGELRETAEAIVARYPNPRSAVLALLFLVQSAEGHVTDDGMREVASILNLKPAEVLAAGSFYTMLKQQPQGKYLFSVCRNLSCTHAGARKVIARLQEHLEIEVGETTPDGSFSLESAECLATCDGAPSMQINYEDFYNVDAEEAVSLVEQLKRGEVVKSVAGEPVKTSREISREIATAGLRTPGTAGDSVVRTIGGESPAADAAPGFRPKAQQEAGRSNTGGDEAAAEQDEGGGGSSRSADRPPGRKDGASGGERPPGRKDGPDG